MESWLRGSELAAITGVEIEDIALSRIGGDEFILILHNVVRTESAEKFARDIISRFDLPYRVGGREVFVTASIGVAGYPIDDDKVTSETSDGEVVDTLLGHAEFAMSAAKQRGKNRPQQYSRELSAKSRERLNVAARLRQAMERQELSLVLRPKYEALDLIYERFTAISQAFGPQAILPFNYAGPHGLLAGGSMDLRFFHQLGATRLARRPLCGGIKAEAFAGTYGAVPTMRPEHVAQARLIIVWGNNITVSQLHLMPLINAARKNGAKLVVVDPRRIQVARQADLHVAVKPGTDVVLAWALAAELERIGGLDHDFMAQHVLGAEAFLEQARRLSLAEAAAECGVPESQIRQLAEMYKTISPAVICPGNGPERNQNGGSGLRAVFALPALAGKFGVLGGGLLQGASAAFPKTLARLQGEELIVPGTRTLNIVTIGRDLLDPTLDPPIKGVFIYNHNPVIVHPDQNTMKRALAQEELFTVACDVVMTDSVRYADVVLPACSHFEHAELYAAYGQHFLQRAEPVIPPVAESLPNTEIFRRLAARFGFTEAAFQATDAELMDAAMALDDPRLQGFTP